MPRKLDAVFLRLALLVCVALGFFGLGLELSHGMHALYGHWYCVTPLVVIALGVLLGVFDFRRSRLV
jgi:hypothetical protein